MSRRMAGKRGRAGRRRRGGAPTGAKVALLATVTLALTACLMLLVIRTRQMTGEAVPVGLAGLFGGQPQQSEELPVTPAPTPSPTPQPTALPDFVPARSAAPVITDTAVMVHGQIVNSYQADSEHTIDFGGPDEYTQMEGIVTFRGNNFRNTSSYGAAALNAAMFGEHWMVPTTGMYGSGSYWG